MILYFSGTGNSKYVAKRIADALGDEIVNLNDVEGRHKTLEIYVRRVVKA